MITNIANWSNIYFFAVVCKDRFFWVTVNLITTFLGCSVVFFFYTPGGYILSLATLMAATLILNKSYSNRYLFFYSFRRNFKMRRHIFWYIYDLHPITYGDFYNLKISAEQLNLPVIFEESLFDQSDVTGSFTIPKMQMHSARVLVKSMEVFVMLKLIRGT